MASHDNNRIVDWFGGTTIQVEDRRAFQTPGNASSFPAFYYISPAPPPSGRYQNTPKSGGVGVTALPALLPPQPFKLKKLPPRAAKGKLHRLIMDIQRENGGLKKYVDWLEAQLAKCTCGRRKGDVPERDRQQCEELEELSASCVQPKAEIVDSSISLTPSGTEALLSCWGDAESEAAVGRGVCEDVEDHNDDLAQRQPSPIQVKAEIVESAGSSNVASKTAMDTLVAGPSVSVSSLPPTSSSENGRQRKSKVEMPDFVEAPSSPPPVNVTPPLKFYSHRAGVVLDELSPTTGNQRSCQNEGAPEHRERSPVKVAEFHPAVMVNRRRMEEQRRWKTSNHYTMAGLLSGISVTSFRSVVPPVISLPPVRHHLPSIMRPRKSIVTHQEQRHGISGTSRLGKPDGRQTTKAAENNSPRASMTKRRRKDVFLQHEINNSDAEVTIFNAFRHKIDRPTSSFVNLDALFVNQ